MSGKQNNKNEIINVSVEEHDIPQFAIDFLTDDKKDYIKIIKAKMRTVGGESVPIYSAKIHCPNLVKHIINHDLEYQIYFKFVKDSALGSIMIYVYDKGVYRVVSESEFKGFLKEYIPEEIRNVKDINEVYQLLLMENDLYIENNKLNSDYRYICFKDCILDLTTMKTLEHTPDIFFSVQLPCNWVPLEDCEDGVVFNRYLDELVSGDEVVKKVILESMGLALSNIPGYFTKKCILMIGPKDCGKTQIKKLLTELIGIEYTSSMELDKMNNNNFATSELYNKRLAGSNDMRYTAINDMGIFKQLTGGDPISIEFKGKGAFSYVFKGFLWFLANDFPMFSGKKGKEIYERFMIIPCKHVVEKKDQDPHLIEKMLAEKEYIVSLCITHLLDLCKRNYKFVTSKSMDDASNKYELMNNTLLQFVDEYCEVIDNGDIKERVNFAKFKKYYKLWCNDVAGKPMKIGKEEIKYYLGPKYGTKVIKSDTNVLSNMKMKESFKEDYLQFGNN